MHRQSKLFRRGWRDAVVEFDLVVNTVAIPNSEHVRHDVFDVVLMTTQLVIVVEALRLCFQRRRTPHHLAKRVTKVLRHVIVNERVDARVGVRETVPENAQNQVVRTG